MKIKPTVRYKNGLFYYVYSCPFCKLSFMHRVNIDKHIRKAHKEDRSVFK